MDLILEQFVKAIDYVYLEDYNKPELIFALSPSGYISIQLIRYPHDFSKARQIVCEYMDTNSKGAIIGLVKKFLCLVSLEKNPVQILADMVQ